MRILVTGATGFIGSMLCVRLSDVAHEVVMLFVKTKNSHGDKSISIQEFMADHDIRADDRDLTYLAAAGLSMIHISLT